MSGALLEVAGLRRTFPAPGLGRRRRVAAVDGVDFTLRAGATLGILGESGSGKSTLGRASLLLDPLDGGQVLYGGRSLLALSSRARRALRPEMPIVLQDALLALDPRCLVQDLVGEAVALHEGLRRGDLMDRVVAAMASVDLPAELLGRYPHELSGGQRQRVGLARALALRPRLIVLDEVLASLDVLLRRRVLDLLAARQAGEGIAYLFISHDAAAVETLAQDVAVMLAGRFIERGPRAAVFRAPAHPYTRALFAAVRPLDPAQPWTPPPARDGGDPALASHGCVFAGRCALVQARCRAEVPRLREIAPGHEVACHLDPPPPVLGLDAGRG